MNYYEELGLTPAATAEEIRQAYRNLARLLHPDQQTDPVLRVLAESQMKRLNSLHAVLADPLERRQYDAGLCQTAAMIRLAPPRPPARRRGVLQGAGLLVAGFALALLFGRLLPPATRITALPGPDAPLKQPPTPAGREDRRMTPDRAARLSLELARAQRELDAARTERDAAVARMEESQIESDQLNKSAAAASESPGSRSIDLDLPPVATVAPERVTANATTSFAGTWVYVLPSIPQPKKALYPAEYVEAVIVEQSGVLQGRYRARYQVADRPISPDVAFRFEGKSYRDSASLNWTGPGGARGEMQLRLLSRDSLEVRWAAVELGSQLGLASGSALLIRRQEP